MVLVRPVSQVTIEAGTSTSILLVDDETSTLRALEGCLAPLGFRVCMATNGADALALLDARPLALAILDLMMPGMDGLELLAHIRAHPTARDTPVIMLTNETEREARLRGLEAGVDDYLEKPLDAAVLLARARTLLRLKQSRDELQASRDALARQNCELEQAQREQRELMEFVIHDLKGPLTGIVANSEWIYEQLDRSDTALLRAVEDVLGSAARLRTLIADLMTVSQLERGIFPIQRRTVALDPIFEQVLREFARAAGDKQIALSGPSDLGQSAELDVGLLQRVLENVLENSLRFTPTCGKITLSAQVDELLRIQVSNSGPAIPETERELIFEKFKRGSNAVARSGSAGLGLYFCKRAVEAHGGRIFVLETSEYPTSFRIQLPLH
jgi:two-component system sensor histidine kinase/response regulator